VLPCFTSASVTINVFLVREIFAPLIQGLGQYVITRREHNLGSGCGSNGDRSTGTRGRSARPGHGATGGQIVASGRLKVASPRGFEPRACLRFVPSAMREKLGGVKEA